MASVQFSSHLSFRDLLPRTGLYASFNGFKGVDSLIVKLRESGMPDETYWESLFDIELILDCLKIDSSLQNVTELGCGYGTFTIPVAKRISGVIETIDIDPKMVKRTRERAKAAGLENIHASVQDILKEGFPVQDRSQDACLLFNILHAEKPVKLLQEVARVVKPEGFVLVIHWRWDIKTPRGPNPEIRPKPEQIIEWARQTKLLDSENFMIDLPPWHYGIRLRRTAS